MGILDKLLGTNASAPQPKGAPVEAGGAPTPQGADAQAIERYRYLLRTAPPDALEKAHAEAFAQLTPEQRRQVLAQMSEGVPASERPQSDDPQALARAATRAEVRQPGFMERTFGGPPGGGLGMGSIIGGSLLSSIAGSFIGSSIAHSLFGGMGAFGGEDAGHSAENDHIADEGQADYDGADIEDGGEGLDDVDLGDDFGGDIDGLDV